MSRFLVSFTGINGVGNINISELKAGDQLRQAFSVVSGS